MIEASKQIAHCFLIDSSYLIVRIHFVKNLTYACMSYLRWRYWRVLVIKALQI
jgi:hypothetical protein